ncbi:Sas10/Utp3/C1D family-domain-containing protein [Cladochytrium replicatum]|nr:Sas10/Utp3/C1D family-domain-containing protein [Cladochytrium replicatum]
MGRPTTDEASAFLGNLLPAKRHQRHADNSNDESDVEDQEPSLDGESHSPTTLATNGNAKTHDVPENDTVDTDAFVALVQDLTTNAQEVQGRVKSLLDRVRSNELPTSKGISLLDVKIHTLLSYITNLTYLILRKSNGSSIFQHKCVDRLAELRVVLEKVRPLELKLKYQIDKLVSLATTRPENKEGGAKEGAKKDTIAAVVEDPLRFKPNPMNLVSKSRDVGRSRGGDDEGEPEHTGVYKPPKLVPMRYDDDPKQAASSRLSARMRERASRSRLMGELAYEFGDRPEELTAEGSGRLAKFANAGNADDERWAERERYEEENFVRLAVTKEDKKYMRRKTKEQGISTFDDEFSNLQSDFAKFNDINSALDADDGSLNRRKQRGRAMLGDDGEDDDDEGAGGRKRKYNDAGELVSTLSSLARTGVRSKFDEDLEEIERGHVETLEPVRGPSRGRGSKGSGKRGGRVNSSRGNNKRRRVGGR